MGSTRSAAEEKSARAPLRERECNLRSTFRPVCCPRHFRKKSGPVFEPVDNTQLAFFAQQVKSRRREGNLGNVTFFRREDQPLEGVSVRCLVAVAEVVRPCVAKESDSLSQRDR
jgi:hypothetical protein